MNFWVRKNRRISPYQGSSVATKNKFSFGRESFTGDPLESLGRSVVNFSRAGALFLWERKTISCILGE